MILERKQPVLVERREAVELHRSDVAARPLDPQDLDRLAGERIDSHDLRRGVAAAEVRDGKVRSQQIRAIQQKFFRLHFRGFFVIPAACRNGEGEGGGQVSLKVHEYSLTIFLPSFNRLRYPSLKFDHMRLGQA